MVFRVSSALATAVVLVGVAFPDALAAGSAGLLQFIARRCGWFYLADMLRGGRARGKSTREEEAEGMRKDEVASRRSEFR